MADTEPLEPVNDADPARLDNISETSGAADGSSESLVFACPNCGESIVLSEAPPNGLVECPACGAQFFATTDPVDIEADARAEADAEAARERREAELSELHVRQVSTLRRSLIRTRSYFMVGAWGSVAATLELAWLCGLKFREFKADKAAGIRVPITDYILPSLEFTCLIASLFCIRYFFRRMKQVALELQNTLMKDPETPPDLSTLGGGIEQWRGLEQMHEQAESDPNDPG